MTLRPGNCRSLSGFRRNKNYSQIRLTQFMRKENSGRESNINNKMQVIVERDAESNYRQGEKTRKM